MNADTTKQNAMSPDPDTLVERVLIARPDAHSADVRRLAPTLSDMSDKVLTGHINRAKRRLAGRTSRRIQK